MGAGKPFDFQKLPLNHRIEVGLGMKDGERKVEEAVSKTGVSINGWRMSSFFGDSAFYNGDWLKRATGAKAGIYGNDSAEAAYPLGKNDVNGNPLDGSKHNYTLTFAADQFPPVNAFWSVTMYDGKTQFLIKNPINRYLINSPMLPELKKNADGSLTLYIQKDSRPIPSRRRIGCLRRMGPSTSSCASTGLRPRTLDPAGREGTWQPPGIVKAN